MLAFISAGSDCLALLSGCCLLSHLTKAKVPWALKGGRACTQSVLGHRTGAAGERCLASGAVLSVTLVLQICS